MQIVRDQSLPDAIAPAAELSGPPPGSWLKQFWLSLALLFVTLATFAPLAGHGFDFVNADDGDYVANNPDVLGGVSASGVRWAFTTFHAYNWHPLTWFSLQLDAQLFGGAPATFHRTNLLLHALNVLLLFWALSGLTGAPGRSAFVAALFAVHPLHVESVAWISERKDVLSTLFWMLSLLAYASYVERPGGLRYLGLLIAFILGLLAKPMLVTLPCVLLLLDCWPLSRLQAALAGGNHRFRRVARLFLEKVPLLLLAGASSVMTVLAQQRIMKDVSLHARIGNALFSYVAYVRKMFWPFDLAIFYPHVGGRLSWWVIGLAALFLIGLTAAVLLTARRRGYLMVGWLWYVGTLVPVIGFVQVGNQGMADRYTYVPLIGLFIMLSWGAVDVARAFRLAVGLPAGLGVLLVVVCALATTKQLRFWRDSIALWTRAVLTVRPAPAIPRYQLGLAFDTAGQKSKALDQYAAALDANPRYKGVHNRMGEILYEMGDDAAAHAQFEEELKTNPESFQAHTGLGGILEKFNELEPARQHYAEALRLHADEITHSNLGRVLRRQGKLAEAAEQFRAALSAAPSSAEAHNYMGLVLEDQGNLADALAEYREAVKLDGKEPVFRYNLALALFEQGQAHEARTEYRVALERAPELPKRFAEDAWNFATAARADWRNGRIALHLAKQACQAVDPPPARSLDALAAAYAECGDFRRAIEFAEKAMRSALAAGDRRLAAEIAARIELYKKGLPYHQPAQEPASR
jgi:tetratricopeptide (TPR) repeat protein